MTNYSTRNEAIDAIVTAIESSPEVRDARAEYNIGAIADEVVSVATDGGYQIADHNDFWESVERHTRPLGRDLYDYNTGERIGPATAEQIAASEAAGDAGVITIDAGTGEVLHNGADPAVWPRQRDVYVA
ncbi:hypothetical protein [Gordonia paraffinivorans]|uniref:hypothetical protein n=1 Tax=Gordonia paraffinivorans TaxID=175628 RepID=UPI001C92C122|nr:hypothetical protein [Gordonia paraffinivorans]